MLYPAELQTRVVKLWENGAVANGCPCARHRSIHLSCGGVWSFLTDAARPAGKGNGGATILPHPYLHTILTVFRPAVNRDRRERREQLRFCGKALIILSKAPPDGIGRARRG